MAQKSKWRITNHCADRFRSRADIRDKRPVRPAIASALDEGIECTPSAAFRAKAIINNGFTVAKYIYSAHWDLLFVIENDNEVVTCIKYDVQQHGERPE